MEIKRLQETGFKGMPKIDMELPKKLFITGSNGAGKTSFIDAINFALTGNLPEGSIVNKAEGKTSVSITLPDGNVVTREKTEDGTIVKYNGKRCTIKALDEAISNNIGIPMESLRIASSAEVIQNMTPAEFSNFVTKYLPENIPVDDIIALLDDADPDAIEIVVNQFGDSVTFSDINNAYSVFFEKRKEAKRRFEANSSALQKLAIDDGFVPDASALKESERKYLEKRDLSAKYETQKKAAEKSASDREKQERVISQTKEELAKLADVTLPDEKAKTELEGEQTETDKQIMAARTTVASLEQNIKALKASVDTISKPVCPLSEKVVCKNVDDKQAIKEELEAAIKNAEDSRQLQLDLVTNLSDKKKEIMSRLEQMRINEQKYVKKASLEKQLKAQTENLIEVQPMPEKPDIADIASLKTAYELLKRQNDNFSAHEKMKAEANDAKHDVEIYDYLVKKFEPKGKVTATVTEKYMFNFNDICNETASMIKPGMELKFISNNGIQILCRMPGKEDYLPFVSLSAGEKMLEILILMDMLSQLTGTRILSLDNVEQLDEETFQMLIDAVGMLEDRYDHIILSCVKHEDLVSLAQKNGLEILNLS